MDIYTDSIHLLARLDPGWYTSPVAGHSTGDGYNKALTPHHAAAPAGGMADTGDVGSPH